MYEEYFSSRISQLRLAKGVSARDMSLSLGQSESYINKIENGKSMPSMQVFFYICDYFQITPQEFFDQETDNPAIIKEIVQDLNALNERQVVNLRELIKDLRK